MSRLDRWIVRKHDADGVLNEAGFIWFERRPILHRFMCWITCALYALAAVGLVALVASNDRLIPGAMFLFGLVAAIVWGEYLLPKICVRKRRLTFFRDGRAFFTYGFPLFGSFEPSEMHNSHHDILSIEVSQSPNSDHVVVIYYRSGEAQPVTMYQRSSDDARIIAVQLQLALQDVHASGKLAPLKEHSERAGVERLLID